MQTEEQPMAGGVIMPTDDESATTSGHARLRRSYSRRSVRSRSSFLRQSQSESLISTDEFLLERRCISPPPNSLNSMRRVSALGMEDPIFGTKEDGLCHPSHFFEDMSLGDVPEDMRDLMSLSSDPTAELDHGLDSSLFHSSLGDLHFSLSEYSQRELLFYSSAPDVLDFDHFDGSSHYTKLVKKKKIYKSAKPDPLRLKRNPSKQLVSSDDTITSETLTSSKSGNSVVSLTLHDLAAEQDLPRPTGLLVERNRILDGPKQQQHLYSYQERRNSAPFDCRSKSSSVVTVVRTNSFEDRVTNLPRSNDTPSNSNVQPLQHAAAAALDSDQNRAQERRRARIARKQNIMLPFAPIHPTVRAPKSGTDAKGALLVPSVPEHAATTKTNLASTLNLSPSKNSKQKLFNKTNCPWLEIVLDSIAGSMEQTEQDAAPLEKTAEDPTSDMVSNRGKKVSAAWVKNDEGEQKEASPQIVDQNLIENNSSQSFRPPFCVQLDSVAGNEARLLPTIAAIFPQDFFPHSNFEKSQTLARQLSQLSVKDYQGSSSHLELSSPQELPNSDCALAQNNTETVGEEKEGFMPDGNSTTEEDKSHDCGQGALNDFVSI